MGQDTRSAELQRLQDFRIEVNQAAEDLAKYLYTHTGPVDESVIVQHHNRLYDALVKSETY